MENDVLQLLKRSPGQRFSLKEIGKALDRKQFREEPNWARPFVQSLVSRSQIEKDNDGRYFAPAPETPG